MKLVTSVSVMNLKKVYDGLYLSPFIPKETDGELAMRAAAGKHEGIMFDYLGFPYATSAEDIAGSALFDRLVEMASRRVEVAYKTYLEQSDKAPLKIQQPMTRSP